MRLIIDMQGAQSASRRRGIGRYTRDLVSAMLDAPRGHEVVLLLNGRQRDAAAELRDLFGNRLPPDAINCWDGPGRQDAGDPAHAGRRGAAEYLRAAAIGALRPDLLLVSSLFEGWHDDGVSAWPESLARPPSAAICYDLIPLMLPELYLPGGRMREWYGRHLLQLRHMDGLLAISEASRREAVDAIGVPAERVAAILAGVSPVFRPARPEDEPADAVAARHGLRPGYVFCVGAVDPRKNVERLIRAYGTLTIELRRRHGLVVTAWNDRAQLMPLRALVAELELDDTVTLLDRFVPEADLPGLYRAAAVAVSPSFHEGFGLSAAEAMACGVPSIASDRTSLPEVVGRADALFDPHDAAAIAVRIRSVLEQPGFAAELARHGLERAASFTWPRAAERCWDALERIAADTASHRLFRPRSRPRLGVVLSARLLDGRAAAFVSALAAVHAVELFSDDPAGSEHWVASALALRPIGRLAAAAPERIVYLLDDAPEQAIRITRLIGTFPGILVELGRPVASLLREGALLPGATGRDARALLLDLSLRAGGWHAVAGNGGGAAAPTDPDAALADRAVAVWRASELPADGNAWAAGVEDAFRQAPVAFRDDMLRRLAAGPVPALPPDAQADVARAAASAMRRPADAPRRERPALFLDVSTQAHHDAGTGIQRVVREVVRQLAIAGLPGYRVEPVIIGRDRFDLARRFGMRMFGVAASGDAPEHADREAALGTGDTFVALDLCLHDIAGLEDTLRRVRAEGGRSFVVVYDLLPVLQPDYFPVPVRDAFPRWLDAIAREADGLLCISRAVADELLGWLDRHRPSRRAPLGIGVFHLGADFLPLDAAGSDAAELSGLDPRRPAFLMVGTVEPRKGHEQALDGFELLWARGMEAALVVVGRAGWMTEALIGRLRNHPELGRRLFWIENGSDAVVARLYREAAALLVASRGEGFGLPLVEAARAGLPVIARRLPVFEEIGGAGASYFDGDDPDALAAAVERWFAPGGAGRPDPALVRTITWAESSREFVRAVVDGARHAEWGP